MTKKADSADCQMSLDVTSCQHSLGHEEGGLVARINATHSQLLPLLGGHL